MDSLKLLIADGNEEFRLALEDALRGSYYVRSCQDGKAALELLRSFHPDVFVLDLMLPALDGISLLHSAAASGIYPMVLATSRFVNDYVMHAATKLGVGYVMMKPCDIPATVDRIRDLSQHLHPQVTYPDPATYLSNLLLSLGIPTKLRGYAYLLEAVPLLAKDSRQSFTKELYPAVSRLYDCEPGNVERSIRSAIHTAWERRDERVWQLHFPTGADGTVPRPTNAAFISRLADSLRRSQNPDALHTSRD